MKKVSQKPQQDVKLYDQPWAECKCGGKIFESGLMFKTISALISPTQQEQNVPVKIIWCRLCGKVPDFASKMMPPIPDELKVK